jgi:hypothetical protein
MWVPLCDVVRGWPHVFVASGPKAVRKGEELTVDYGDAYWECRA